MSVLSPDDAVAFLQHVLQQTQTNKLVWWENEHRKGFFNATTDRYLFTILDRDEDELAPFRFLIRRRSDNATLDEIDTALEPDARAGEINSLLTSIYQLVAGKARGTENLAQELLTDLDALRNEPF